MRSGIIVTAVGRDRPGIVDRLSGLVFRESCNLEDSRMAILGGQFALIALVTGSEQAIERLRETLPGFESELDLKVHIERAELEAMSLEEKPEALLYRITAVAMDHPGIVHRISSILARSGVNVAALDTRISLAPTTGTPVFALTIEAQVPASLPVSELRALLDDVATRENLDLELHAVT